MWLVAVIWSTLWNGLLFCSRPQLKLTLVCQKRPFQNTPFALKKGLRELKLGKAWSSKHRSIWNYPQELVDFPFTGTGCIWIEFQGFPSLPPWNHPNDDGGSASRLVDISTWWGGDWWAARDSNGEWPLDHIPGCEGPAEPRKGPSQGDFKQIVT